MLQAFKEEEEGKTRSPKHDWRERESYSDHAPIYDEDTIYATINLGTMYGTMKVQYMVR